MHFISQVSRLLFTVRAPMKTNTTTVTTTNVVTKTLGAPPSRIYTIIPKTFTIVLVATNTMSLPSTAIH